MPTVETRHTRTGTRYFVRVRDPRKAGRATSRTFATRPEADAFCRDVTARGPGWALEQHDLADQQADELTLDAWAAVHFASMTRASPGTVERYRRIYARVWSPLLGEMPLSAIGRPEVAAAVLAVPGMDKTVRNAWGVLTGVFKTAVLDGHLAKAPTVGVQLPRRSEHEEVEHRYLTHEEWWRVLDATPAYWRPLMAMLGGTGMRWGEMAALTVGDVDQAGGTVRVRRAERVDPEQPSKRVVGPTKTRRSRRTVTLPVEVLDYVEPLLARGRGERLFLPPRGGPLRHRTFYRDLWQRVILPGAGLVDPQPRLHDLRHSHVAWLVAAGAPLPVIQARLGHEQISTTIDTYGHLLPDVQRAAADAAGMVFRRPAKLEQGG